MARQMVSDGDEVYRLKVTVTAPDGSGREFARYYGPFNSLGAARGQRTVYVKNRRRVVSAQIQHADVKWSDVE